MIKKLRYLCTLLLIAVASTAWGEEESVTFSEQGYENGQVIENYTGTAFSISFDKGTNSNAPKYYTTGTAIRCYGGNTFTVSSDKEITNIALTFSSGEGTNAITTNVGDYSNNTWSGSNNSVTFTISGTTGHRRLASVKVTFSTSAAAVATPTFSLPNGTYVGTQSVGINCETTDATIYYTIDGTDPTSESTQYTGTISITGSCTVKAIAIKGSDKSSIATAKYTIVSISHAGTEADPYTVADARVAIDANYGVTDVYVKGVISQIDSYNATYGSITYWISEDGTTTNQFEVYGGLNLNNSQFTSIDDVVLGAEVVVFGNIKKYNDIYEFDKNNYLVSYVAPTISVAAPVFSPEAGTYTESQNVTITCETQGANIYYTVDGTEPTKASTQYTAAIEVNKTTTIKAVAYVGEVSSRVETAIYEIQDPNAPGMSADNPYTVEQARAAIDAGDGVTGVYAKGKVSKIVTAYNADYGNISYNISDDGSETAAQLQSYRGKSYNGENFTSADDIKVGDEVVVFGNLKKHNSTYEFDAGNQLVSLTRPETPVTLPVPSFSPAAGEVEAGTTVKINIEEDENVDYVLYKINDGEWQEYSDETVITITEETIIYARAIGVDESEGEIATAKYTIKAVTPAQDVVIVEDGKTTFLFNTEGNEWGFPVGSTNKIVEETAYTVNDVTIKVAGSAGNGFYYNNDGMLMLGKLGAYLTLPAFDFAVGKIEVTGKSGASTAVKQNIFVGENAVSTETTGAQGMNTYVIAADYQAAGNVYTLKVTSAHNTQITQIVVYKATGEEKADPQLRFSTATATATLGSEFAAPTLSYVDGFDGTVKYESSNTGVATVDATTGEVTLVAAGEAIIKATSEETANYLAGEASYTLIVKEPAVAGDDKYELVTAASTLKAGDEIVFAFVGTLKISSVDTKVAQAMGTEFGNNSVLLAVDVVDNEDQTISTGDDVMFLTLGGAEDAWTFESNGKYLTSTGKKKNEDGTTPSTNQNTIELTEDGTDTHAQAHIQIAEDGEATVTFNGGNGCNWLQYNVNGGKNQRFSCYSAKMSGLQIYRKVTSTETHSGNVNGDPDGKVDIADVTALVNIIVNNSDLTPEQLAAGDFDNSGNLTVEDVEALVNKILGNQ